MKKCEVNGPNSHDVFTYLRNNSELYDQKKNIARRIPGTFAKFLVSREGKVINYYPPSVEPLAIKPDLEQYLNKK